MANEGQAAPEKAEKKPRAAPSRMNEELIAMNKIHHILAGLSPSARCRVLEWNRDRLEEEQSQTAELRVRLYGPDSAINEEGTLCET